MIQALAPMDGITDIVYRTVVQKTFDKYSKNKNDVLRTWTEFMNTDGYMIQPAKLIKHLMHHEQEKKLIAQIYGGNMDTLIKTAIDIEKKYPDFFGVELNIGCPSPKVMACGGGSGMMQDKKHCLEVIKNISNAINKPFSIKVRTGLNQEDKKQRFDTLTKAIPYVHCISIHGRTFKQGHTGPNDWDYIYRFKQQAACSIKVIGNGGITSYDDAIKNQKKPGRKYKLDGIMTAQSAIANPRIFTGHSPEISERFETTIYHLNLAASYEIRYKRTLQKNPQLQDDKSQQLVLNRKSLHLLKKYDEKSDKKSHIPNIDFHQYLFPMPKLHELEHIADNIEKLTQKKELEDLYCPIEFRKHLFNYVKGLEGNKDFKKHVATIKDFSTLKRSIQKYFVSLQ